MKIYETIIAALLGLIALGVWYIAIDIDTFTGSMHMEEVD